MSKKKKNRTSQGKAGGKRNRKVTKQPSEDPELAAPTEPVSLDDVDLTPLLMSGEKLLAAFREDKEHRLLSRNGFPTPPDVHAINSARRELKRALEPFARLRQEGQGCLVSDKRLRLPDVLDTMQEIVEKPQRPEAPGRLEAAVDELREMLGVEAEVKPASAVPTDDSSAYVHAIDLWSKKFTTYKRFNTWFKKINAEKTVIQFRHKGQHLYLHAGDWHKHCTEQDAKAFEMLDDGAMDEYLANKREREAKLKEQKASRGK